MLSLIYPSCAGSVFPYFVLGSSYAILPWVGPLEVPTLRLRACDFSLVQCPVLLDGAPWNR
jgi:hypothetical protein